MDEPHQSLWRALKEIPEDFKKRINHIRSSTQTHGDDLSCTNFKVKSSWIQDTSSEEFCLILPGVIARFDSSDIQLIESNCSLCNVEMQIMLQKWVEEAHSRLWDQNQRTKIQKILEILTATLAAITNSLGRILLLDSQALVVVRLWKISLQPQQGGAILGALEEVFKKFDVRKISTSELESIMESLGQAALEQELKHDRRAGWRRLQQSPGI
ncbi:hypothetical protein Fmac_011097 [Flemingia macrophylla]|uniref:Rab3-GAP regulatory subunit N-terminal domain-containing protein n=1 Tax=Flemingia macrophylla TaxID=520843 RepID=A0ABD1MLG9_9FABA